jgi:hypothetical protein
MREMTNWFLLAGLGLLALASRPFETPVLAQGAVAFQPVVSSFPSGVTLDVTPAVSADRRYVRLGLAPNFTGLNGFDTFAVPAAVGGGGFAGMNGFVGGAGGMGGGGAAGAGGGGFRAAGLGELGLTAGDPGRGMGMIAGDPFANARNASNQALRPGVSGPQSLELESRPAMRGAQARMGRAQARSSLHARRATRGRQRSAEKIEQPGEAH